MSHPAPAELPTAPPEPFRTYDLLLEEFMVHARRSPTPSTKRFFQVPNALAQDIPFADAVLVKLRQLDDETLASVARCSEINHRRMLRRSAVGWASKAFVVLGAFAALLKGIGEL